MTTKYVGEGLTADYVAPAAIVSGAVVVMGAVVGAPVTVGVALDDIASGATGAVQIRGVFDIAKVSADVIAQGESVNWDTSASAIAKNAATAATGDVEDCAIAMEAAGNGVTTIAVQLLPGRGLLKA